MIIDSVQTLMNRYIPKHSEHYTGQGMYRRNCSVMPKRPIFPSLSSVILPKKVDIAGPNHRNTQWMWCCSLKETASIMRTESAHSKKIFGAGPYLEYMLWICMGCVRSLILRNCPPPDDDDLSGSAVAASVKDYVHYCWKLRHQSVLQYTGTPETICYRF